MAARVQAFRTYGTDAELRRTLADFRRGGPGFVTTLAPAAGSRLHRLVEDIEGLQTIAFDRFVARCLTLAMQPMLPIADEVQVLEALAQVCRRLSPESPFHDCRGYPGFVRRLNATLRELRQWRIYPDELRRHAEQAEPWLGGKLYSLADIGEALSHSLRDAARELPEDRLERCLGTQIGETKPRLFLYAGAEYSPLEAEWIRWAVLQGIEIEVALDGHPTLDTAFRGSERMANALESKPRFRGEPKPLADALFGTQPPLDPALDVEIFSAADPLSECEWALRALAKDNAAGMPWGIGAIYVRSLEDYGPLLSAAAERFGVPLRLSVREKLEANGWIRFLLKFLDGVLAASPNGLKNLAASSYVGNSAETAKLHREAISLASHAEEPWTDLRARLDSENLADRWLLDAIRLATKRDLEDVSFREWADELQEVTDGPWLGKAIEAESASRNRDRAARAAFFHAIDERATLSDSAGEMFLLSEFVADLHALARQLDCNHALREEGVAVVSSSAALGGAHTLCVLGMIEGAFPRRRSEDPILSDFERTSLDALRPGNPPLKTSHDVAAAERDELIRLCAAADRRLLLMYPQVGDERDNTRAFYLSEIDRVAGAAVRHIDVPAARLAPEGELLFEADRVLAQALQGPRSWAPMPDLKLEESRELIRGLPADGLSAFELRDAARCPFKYVFARRFEVYPWRAEAHWWRLRQLPQATGLNRAEDAEQAAAALEKGLELELEELGSEIEPADRFLMEAGGKRLIREWVEREFLSRKLWPKHAGTEVYNVPFGAAGTAEELPLDDRKLKLRGELSSVAEMSGYAVGQLYGTRKIQNEGNLDRVEDADLIDIGVRLFSLAKKNPNAALEVETHNGERILYLLPRRPDVELPSRVAKKVRTVDLGEKKPFYDRLREVLERAARRIEVGELVPVFGEHCEKCDHGELCRCAPEWGERLSPFEGNVRDWEDDVV